MSARAPVSTDQEVHVRINESNYHHLGKRSSIRKYFGVLQYTVYCDIFVCNRILWTTAIFSCAVRLGCIVSELLPLDLGDTACRGKRLSSLL